MIKPLLHRNCCPEKIAKALEVSINDPFEEVEDEK